MTLKTSEKHLSPTFLLRHKQVILYKCFFLSIHVTLDVLTCAKWTNKTHNDNVTKKEKQKNIDTIEQHVTFQQRYFVFQ